MRGEPLPFQVKGPAYDRYSVLCPQFLCSFRISLLVYYKVDNLSAFQPPFVPLAAGVSTAPTGTGTGEGSRCDLFSETRFRRRAARVEERSPSALEVKRFSFLAYNQEYVVRLLLRK